jgi:hypothetical protein
MMTRTIRKFIGRTSSSSSSPAFYPPRATVPLHLLSNVGVGARIYGNFTKERGGYSYGSSLVYGGVVCHIWEEKHKSPGMVAFNRLRFPKASRPAFVASDECTEQWVKDDNATIEFTIGYVYRSDSPCPEGAVPLFHLHESKIGVVFTVSEREKDLCLRLGARDLGIECYVAPP